MIYKTLAAKYYPRTPGRGLRPFRPNSGTRYAQQLASWNSVRKEMKALSLKSKKQRGSSCQVSKREVKNLQSSLGCYWELEEAMA
jgi:hypothetical protein